MVAASAVPAIITGIFLLPEDQKVGLRVSIKHQLRTAQQCPSLSAPLMGLPGIVTTWFLTLPQWLDCQDNWFRRLSMEIKWKCLDKWFRRLSTTGITKIIDVWRMSIEYTCQDKWLRNLSINRELYVHIVLKIVQYIKWTCLDSWFTKLPIKRKCLDNWLTKLSIKRNCLDNWFRLQSRLLNGIAWMIYFSKLSTKWKCLDRCHRQYAAIDLCSVQ